MRQISTVAVLLLSTSLVVAPSVGAQQAYVIHVAVESATFTDYLALADWYQTALAGSEMPADIARAAAAAVAEVAVAAAVRVGENAVLTLDDGQQVPLHDGDEVRVGAYLADNSATRQITPLVVIVRGAGVATVLGRTDLVAPSSL